jgi:NAD(P)H-hydrate epimerase
MPAAGMAWMAEASMNETPDVLRATAPAAGFAGTCAHPAALLASADMYALDATTIAAGTAGSALMERAGASVADVAAAMAARQEGARPVLVLCGPGNNGGDGYVAARLLAARGLAVTVASLDGRSPVRGDAGLAASRWTGEVHGMAALSALLDARPLIVDALFGAGLARDIDGDAARTIAAINASRLPVLAVDIPSGIDGDTGAVRGIAVRAQRTVTFGRLKRGHVLMPGRAFCGDVVLADIGWNEPDLLARRATCFLNDPALWFPAFPVVALDTHKYERGHACVLSGPATRTGAARLAARGALRVGAGLVTVMSPPDALAENAAQLTAIMLREIADDDGFAAMLTDTRIRVLVMGPGAGVGPALALRVGVAAATTVPLVLDADALTSFAGDPDGLAAMLAGRGAPTVLTPHEGEFARLFGLGAPMTRLDRACAAARQTGAIVVLKGPDTIVAAPDGSATVARNAPPWLATAGSGDVLAGFIAGLIAQGMDSAHAAACAVWLHGEAGARCGPGLIAEDLPEALPAVLRALVTP